MGVLGVIAILFVAALIPFQKGHMVVSHPIAHETVETRESELIPLEASTPVATNPSNADEAPATPADGLPDWLNQPARMVDGAYEVTIASDPYTTKEECDAALDEELIEVTRGYLKRLGAAEGAGLPVDLKFIRQRICRGEFTEVKETSVGPMRQVHLLLTFDEPVAAELKSRLHAQQVKARLVQVGGGTAAALGLLAAVWGFLKLGGRKGTSPQPLQAAAGAGILALLTVAAQWA